MGRSRARGAYESADAVKFSANTLGAGRTAVYHARAVTVWAALDAERLGFDEDDALAKTRVVAGLNA